MAGEACADRGADRGDFVFSLKRLDAEVLVSRQFMQDVRRGRDGIRTIEQAAAGQFRGGYKTNRRRFVTSNLAVAARSDDCFLDRVMGGENFGGLGEVISGLKRDLICLRKFRVLPELCIDPI